MQCVAEWAKQETKVCEVVDWPVETRHQVYRIGNTRYWQDGCCSYGRRLVACWQVETPSMGCHCARIGCVGLTLQVRLASRMNSTTSAGGEIRIRVVVKMKYMPWCDAKANVRGDTQDTKRSIQRARNTRRICKLHPFCCIKCRLLANLPVPHVEVTRGHVCRGTVTILCMCPVHTYIKIEFWV